MQDDQGAIPGLNYRAAFWSDHTAYTNIYQGSLSYVTGTHSSKFGVLQAWMTTGMIMGRRRWVSLTHLPSCRRITCCNR